MEMRVILKSATFDSDCVLIIRTSSTDHSEILLEIDSSTESKMIYLDKEKFIQAVKKFSDLD